jgi:SulP family sulfate permease
VVAIEIGIVLASILFMKRMSDVTSIETTIRELNDQPDGDMNEEMHSDNMSDKVMVYDINGPFFFGAADTFINIVRSMQKLPKVLVIRMKKVPAMDATACHALQGLLKKCRKNKTKVFFTHVRPQPLRTLQNYGIIEELGEDAICSSTDEAIKKANIA